MIWSRVQVASTVSAESFTQLRAHAHGVLTITVEQAQLD